MTTAWPENFTSSADAGDGFAWFPSAFDEVFRELAAMAEPEDWDYHFTTTPFKRLPLDQKFSFELTSSCIPSFFFIK